MQVSTVIFDLDGTLIDTLEDLAQAVNVAVAAAGFPQLTAEEVRMRIGHGVRNLLAQAMPAGTEAAIIDTGLATMKAYYEQHLTVYTHPYAGIPEILRAIRQAGVQTAVLSNKYDAGAKMLVEHFFPGEIDFTLGERVEVPRKPDPTAVFEILETLHADPAATIYVGDSATDMQTAKNAGLFAVGVTWGFRDRADLVRGGADVVIDHPNELLPLLMIAPYDRSGLEAAFQRNRFAFSYFATKEEACAYLATQCAGKQSAFGGSMTLDALGLYEQLKAANEDVCWHWKGDAIRSAGDVFLTSANALSATGEIVNIDGNCNRIAGAMWGFRDCYVVCGRNKLTVDLQTALDRARQTAAPRNARRLNRNTPCAVDGVCHDCHSPERICSTAAITFAPPHSFEHYEVILIDEPLGY